MKPVDQDRFGDGQDGAPPGNCFAACLASLLEVPLSEVPELIGPAEPEATPERTQELWMRFIETANAWLAPRGLMLVEMDWEEVPDWAWTMVPPDALIIARGPAARGFPHCCVYRGRFLVHDPHPKRVGLEMIYGLTWLAVRDPVRR